MDHPVFDHEGPFTERDFLALAPGSGQVDLMEGTLVVGPGPGPEHDKAVAAVRAALDAALPAGLRVLSRVPLRMGTDCVLVPDLVVARAAPQEQAGDAAPAADAAEDVAADPGPDEVVAAPAEEAQDSTDQSAPEVLDCADALIVVDVVGRSHGVAQRWFKPQLYARGAIPYAVLVDSDEPFGVANMIIGGRYHEFARAGAGERLVLDEPFAIEVDLAAVTS